MVKTILKKKIILFRKYREFFVHKENNKNFKMYDYLAMISENSTLTLELLKEKLEKFYSKNERKIDISLTDKSIHLQIENFTFYISLNDDDYVLIESHDIAKNFAVLRTDREQIASCKKRIEISDTDNDDDVDYFNDSLYIIEILESFSGVFVFNPQDGTFMDEY